jgi:hypothetical protein
MSCGSRSDHAGGWGAPAKTHIVPATPGSRPRPEEGESRRGESVLSSPATGFRVGLASRPRGSVVTPKPPVVNPAVSSGVRKGLPDGDGLGDAFDAQLPLQSVSGKQQAHTVVFSDHRRRSARSIGEEHQVTLIEGFESTRSQVRILSPRLTSQGSALQTGPQSGPQPYGLLRLSPLELLPVASSIQTSKAGATGRASSEHEPSERHPRSPA